MSEFKYQHGLSIMRAQPFHIGHARLIDKMLKECAQVTIILGSIQEQGTERNPLNYTTRKKMIQNVYRQRPEYERLKVIGLFDINNPAEWAEYVLDFMAESLPQLGKPDVYYAGSSYDAHWFKGAFQNIEYVDRTAPDFPFVTGTMVRDMIKFGDTNSQDTDIRYNNIPLFRLSEVYLNAAEAAVKGGEQDKAYTYLDAIVNRANPTKHAASPVTLEAVLKERRKELVGEGHRFFDAMRNNETIVRYTSTADQGWQQALTEEARSFNRDFYKTLLPVPEYEMNANPEMKQNPGY